MAKTEPNPERCAAESSSSSENSLSYRPGARASLNVRPGRRPFLVD